MQVPCPICKKLFPIRLIDGNVRINVSAIQQRRENTRNKKLENVMSGTFETQRKQLRYHGYMYKCSFNIRVINSIYIGCEVVLFVLGCFAFVDEQKFNVKIPAGPIVSISLGIKREISFLIIIPLRGRVADADVRSLVLFV